MRYKITVAYLAQSLEILGYDLIEMNEVSEDTKDEQILNPVMRRVSANILNVGVVAMYKYSDNPCRTIGYKCEYIAGVEVIHWERLEDGEGLQQSTGADDTGILSIAGETETD